MRAWEMLLAFFSLVLNMSVIRYLKDQRGETAPDGDDEEEDQDEDDLDLEGVDLGEEESSEEDEDADVDEDEDEDADEDEDDGEPETLESLTKKFGEMEKEFKERGTKIYDLNKALHDERQKRKSGKDDDEAEGEEVLTDAQIVALMEEHKDDPATLLRINRYVAQQAAKGSSKEAVNELEVSSTQKAINDELYKAYPDLMDEGTEQAKDVGVAKDKLFLKDHPLADYLAASALIHNNLDVIKKAEYDRGVEEGKKSGMGNLSEKQRKAAIKAAQLSGKGKGSKKKGSSKLSKGQADTAVKLGLSKRGQKIYAGFLDGDNSVQEV